MLSLCFLLNSVLYTALKHTHSGLRYIILILILVVLIKSLMGWLSKKPYTPLDKLLSLVSMSLVHTQLIIGIILWFVSEEVQAGVRYWRMEHPAMMLLAIVAFTLAYSFAKRKPTDEAKHKTTFIYYAIGTGLVFAALASKGLLF